MAEVLSELVAKVKTDLTGLRSGLKSAEGSISSWAKQNEK